MPHTHTHHDTLSSLPLPFPHLHSTSLEVKASRIGRSGERTVGDQDLLSARPDPVLCRYTSEGGHVAPLHSGGTGA